MEAFLLPQRGFGFRPGGGAPACAPQSAPTQPPYQPQELKADLRRLARRLGLAALGFVEARRWVRLQEELARRVQEGTYPAFCERDPALRCDPQQWLPGARSLWVAAWPYQPPRPAPQPAGAPQGRLAAYAICPDYHRGLRRRLEVLVRWAARRCALRPEAHFRVLVDTGPPVERELLRLSGAGVVGKNTCAFVPQAGSWVVLGVVVSTLALPADPEAAEPEMPPQEPAMCLNCRRCLDACPTGALQPYRIDPARCISHLTQLRGPLPEDQRLSLRGWVFGCDLCQLACPHNGPEQAPLAFHHPRRLRPAPDLSTRAGLAWLLGLSGEEFTRLFGPTAAAWRGRSVLQRNAAYAAAEALRRAGPGSYPELRAALAYQAENHPSPVVREACRWALNPPPRPNRRPLRPSRTPPCAGPSLPGGGTPDR